MNDTQELEKIHRIQSKIFEKAVKNGDVSPRYHAIDAALGWRMIEIEKQSHLRLERTINEYFLSMLEDSTLSQV